VQLFIFVSAVFKHFTATGQLDQGFPWFFLGPRTNAEMLPKFNVALHASHAAFQS
jgi:hypothetical protein